MAFNQGQRLFRTRFTQAETAAIAEAVAWVEALRADGGTEIAEALNRGLSLAGESRGSRAQRIVFLTDGAVQDEETVLSMIVRLRGEMRLHAIGIGDAPNRYLLRKMAELGHGLCEFISSGESGPNRIAEFLERVDRPLLTRLELSWEGMELEEIFPPALPDLHAGQSWAVVGRLRQLDADGKLRLTGHSASGWFEREAQAHEVAGPQAGISKRWARAKIDSILDEQHRGRDAESVRSEVVALALEHQIVTRHTSLIAVDDRPTASGAARAVNVAGVLPRGGTDARLRRLLAMIFLVVGATGCWVIRR
jgi:Ca-activated chloride channel family protein